MLMTETPHKMSTRVDILSMSLKPLSACRICTALRQRAFPSDRRTTAATAKPETKGKYYSVDEPECSPFSIAFSATGMAANAPVKR
jgi:hypothetical protein